MQTIDIKNELNQNSYPGRGILLQMDVLLLQLISLWGEAKIVEIVFL